MAYALCVVLVSPVVKLHGEFVTWRTKMRVKTGGTPQVCMLRQIIKDELGIDVLIEEGNGKPIDFIVKTSFVNVDIERQLFALLDRYKLAGKSYGYENAEILYDNRWTAYLCEKIRSNTITITFYWNGKPGDGEIKKISIRSDVIVKTCSDICFIIGQKNCQMFVAKLYNFLHPHNRMRFYPAHSVLSFPDFAVDTFLPQRFLR